MLNGHESRGYIALIRKEEGTDYWVDIPDLPGCVSCGAERDQAIAAFEEALALHMRGMTEDAAPFPPARPLKDVIQAEAHAFVEAFVVEILI